MYLFSVTVGRVGPKGWELRRLKTSKDLVGPACAKCLSPKTKLGYLTVMFDEKSTNLKFRMSCITYIGLLPI